MFRHSRGLTLAAVGVNALFVLACGGGSIAPEYYERSMVFLEGASPGPERDRAMEITRSGWLHASEVGMWESAGFVNQVERAVDDGRIDAAELAGLEALAIANGFAPKPLSGEEQAKLVGLTKAVEQKRAEVAADFADWPGENPVRTRGEALGWDVETCSAYDTDGHVQHSCVFNVGEDEVRVDLHRLRKRAEARDFTGSHPEYATSTRDGKYVLEVTATSAKSARAVLGELKDFRRGPPKKADLSARVKRQGLHLEDCHASSMDGYQNLDCRLTGRRIEGSVNLSWTRERYDDEGPVVGGYVTHVDGPYLASVVLNDQESAARYERTLLHGATREATLASAKDAGGL